MFLARLSFIPQNALDNILPTAKVFECVRMDNTGSQFQEALVRLAEEAGRLVMKSSRNATLKSDGTDVTPADIQSHNFLTAGIRQLAGDDARILSEEGAATVGNVGKGYTFVIDPLDGTTNFKNGKRNFSVLVAVLKDGVPVFGVAVAPAYGLTAVGGTLAGGSELRLHDKRADAAGTYRHIKKLTPPDNTAVTAVVPRRFVTASDASERTIIQQAMAAFSKRLGAVTFEPSGEILGSMMPILKQNVRYRIYEAVRPNQRPGDWDLAAWDAILRGAGGMMTDGAGKPLQYGDAGNDYKHQNFISWRKAGEAQAYAASDCWAGAWRRYVGAGPRPSHFMPDKNKTIKNDRGIS